jgi:puromycin-sensitive aminopeptidase
VTTDSEANYRLPRPATPSRYEIRLSPRLQAGTFSGSVDISLDVREPLTEIVLNAKELDVRAGSLGRDGDGRVIDVQKVVMDPEAERATLELAETAEVGPWVLTLTYGGPLNDRLTGFYRSRYEEDGTERLIAASHFEATDARMAFPCWDEPDLKAVFSIAIEVDDGQIALSNGPEVAREPAGDGRLLIRFADTMPMSTYLVALIVGPLALTEARDVRGVPVRVASRPGTAELAEYALVASDFCLRWFGDYYGIPYPEAKLDNVALPDFAQGAMENVGCVTYREALLLVDPGSSTTFERLNVFDTVAHELAHMWFGDLVTMRWWNGIWLNEAFATFMANACTDAAHPEWRVLDAFARARANAFEIDALETTRAIEYPVHSPDDASGMFDTLTYTKGGSVLRMLEQWLGPERFRDGIRRYLRAHAYGNTETHDLWDALEEETGEPVRRVMDAWIFQPGYPAITVRRDGERLRFSERRFIPSRPDDPTVWPVPLIVRQITGGREVVDRILVEAEGTELAVAAADGIVVANAGGASFVRTFYDDDLRQRLVSAAFDVLTPVERQCLVDDAWAAVVAGHAPASSFVDLVASLGAETDPSVWQAILTGLTWCDRFVEGTARRRFQDFVRDLVRPAFERLTWDAIEGEPELDRELRGDLVRALGVLGDDPETQAHAREAERDPGSEPSVTAAAVDVVAHAGGPEEHERFAARAKEAPTPQEQLRYLVALGRFRDPALMDRTLASTLGDDIRAQDAPYVIARSLINRDLGGSAWRFVSSRWDELNDRLASSNMISMVSGARWITDPAGVASVQEFFRDHDLPQNRLMLQQMLERQRIYAALRERAEPDLRARFAGEPGGASGG